MVIYREFSLKCPNHIMVIYLTGTVGHVINQGKGDMINHIMVIYLTGTEGHVIYQG